MSNDIVVIEEQEAEEAPKSSETAFLLLCVLLILGGVGYMMYRIANEPRQLAGDIPEHHVAPPGTYFAREYVTMTKPNGVIGLPPGTAVFVRQKGGEQWVVNDGIDDISLKATSLTVDVELAAKLRAHDAEAQSRAAASQARAEAIYQAELVKKSLSAGAEMDSARQRMAGAPVGAGTALNQPAQLQPGGVATYPSSYGGYVVPSGPSFYNYQTQQWISAR